MQLIGCFFRLIQKNGVIGQSVLLQQNMLIRDIPYMKSCSIVTSLCTKL